MAPPGTSATAATPFEDEHAIQMAILEQVLKIPLFIRDRGRG
jgi:hypothetical protein